jgi:hypothetical protein
MSEAVMEIRGTEAQTAGVLRLAERILGALEGSADPVHRNRLLLQASFLVRLAAAQLIEPDFPALPHGFWRLLDRDRARVAARQLAESRGRRYRSFSKRASKPTPPDRTGSPQTEIDRRLAAATAATLENLRSVRRDLLREYLDLASRNDAGSRSAEVRAATLALVDGYWRSGRQLLGIEEANHAQKPRRARRAARARLRRPLWEDRGRTTAGTGVMLASGSAPESTTPCRKKF